MECFWEPRSCVVPHTNSILELSDNTIKFKGYWYIEPECVPIERIITVYREEDKGTDYHIQITKIMKEDEPFRCSACERGEECDPEENHIRFFPCEIITLEYRPIVKIQTRAYYNYVVRRIEQLDEDKKLKLLVK
jgi:hypothetical protein